MGRPYSECDEPNQVLRPEDMRAQVPGQADCWAYRGENMRCKTCMWFAPKYRATDSVVDIGRCRRHAPTMNGYPVVFVNDWCGDHKLNENSLA